MDLAVRLGCRCSLATLARTGSRRSERMGINIQGVEQCGRRPRATPPECAARRELYRDISARRRCARASAPGGARCESLASSPSRAITTVIAMSRAHLRSARQSHDDGGDDDGDDGDRAPGVSLEDSLHTPATGDQAAGLKSKPLRLRAHRSAHRPHPALRTHRPRREPGAVVVALRAEIQPSAAAGEGVQTPGGPGENDRDRN